MARDYDPYADEKPIRENPRVYAEIERDEAAIDAKAVAEELRAVYGIAASMGLRQRVSKLYDYGYRDAEDVATTLALRNPEERKRVVGYLKEIESEIERAGREQTPAELAQHKGMAIRRLERLQVTLEEQMPMIVDPTKLSAVSNQIRGIESQILTLRGVDRKQAEKDEKPDVGAALIAKIAGLGTERIALLRSKVPTTS